MSIYQGKVAVITGGTTGIGFATAKRLLEGGAKVVVTGRGADALATAATTLPGALAVRSDTAALADIDELVAEVKRVHGHIDFLFVNAGIAKFLPLEQVDAAFFDETFNINTRGAYFTVQKFAPLIRSGGSIVVNTSIVDEKGMQSTSVYAASKAALRSLARTFAAELVGRGIRVNAVSPGPISTPIYDKLGLDKQSQDGFATQLRDANPMKRFGQPDEVARAALFLGFDATFTTGAELPIDGGVTQL